MADIVFNKRYADNFYHVSQTEGQVSVGTSNGVCVRDSNVGITSFVKTAAFQTGDYNVSSISLLLFDCAMHSGYSGHTVPYFAISDQNITTVGADIPTSSFIKSISPTYKYDSTNVRNTYIGTFTNLALVPNVNYYIYIYCGPKNSAWDCLIYPYGSSTQRETTLSITFDQKEIAYATATFNANGGSEPSPSTITVTRGSALGALPTTSRTGYTFNGWYTATSGGTKIDSTTILNSDTTYYAQWTAKVLTLTYDANGGSGAPGAQSWTYNSSTSITLSSTIPTRNGYTFLGWSESASASSATWVEGASISSTQWSTNTTIYAVWSANIIKITFDPNGGSGGTTNIWYKYGVSTFYSNSSCTTQITAITRPTRTGYKFLNYHGDGTCGGSNNERYVAYDNKEFADDLATDIYKDATLYAEWEALTYTLSYNANSGTGAPAAQTWTYGGTNITVSSTIPTRTGSTFEGWAESSSASSAAFQAGGSISSTKWAENKTLYAVWSINSYTLTIDANGGYRASDNSTDIITVTKNYNQSETISERKRTGYTLSGYDMTATSNGSTSVGGAAFSFNSSTKVGTFTQGTVDVTLAAKWTPNIYKVTLDNQSATSAGTTAYWYKFNTTEVISGETIYYYTNSGCTTPLTGYKITCPTKTNYKFGGYYTAINGGGTQYVNASGYCVNNLYSGVAGNTTLYAHWVAITDVIYTVQHWQKKLSSTDSTLVDTDTLTGTAGASVTPPVKTYAGFTSPSTQTATIKEDGSLVINYYYTRKNFTLTVNKGTGIASVSGTGTYQYGSSATINATLSKGYKWSKWTGYNTSTTQKLTFTIPAQNVTYTANATALTYTISYNANGGTGSIASHTVTYNTTATIKNNSFTPPRGQTFAGWTTKSDGTNDGYGWFNSSTLNGWTGTWTYVNGESGISNQKLVLYAMWKPLTYTISYKANGGSGSIASHTVNYGSNVTISNNSFTAPTGHKFAGWTTKSDGTNDGFGWFNASTLNGWSGTWSYINGQYGIADQKLVLYAMWSKKSYKLTINPKSGTWGGTTSSSSFTQEYQSTKSIAPPTRPGYIFAGWYKTSYGALNNSTATNPIMSSSSNLPMTVYNNSQDGSVTINRKSDTGAGFTYTMEITTASPHTSKPGLGGFVTSTNAASGASFIHVIRAKIPTGYYLSHHANSVGDNPTWEWLTIKEGTGAWHNYAYKLTCSTSGTFKNFGYVALNNSSNTVPVTWYVGGTQVTKNPTSAQTFTYGAGDTTLYAQWIPETVEIYYNDKWSRAIPYIYNGSDWKQTIPYVYNNGWKAIQ